jgi:hypothetical protein
MWTDINATTSNPHVSISAHNATQKRFASSFANSALVLLYSLSTLLFLLLGSL